MGAVSDLGKVLIAMGGVLVVVGLVLVLGSRFSPPIGRLPGDIVYRGKSTTFYFPILTCILLSVILTLVMYVVNRSSR